MIRPRVIPCLLVESARLVKTIRYGNPAYIGDPVNAIKIFNQKEVDELIVLDIGVHRTGYTLSLELISTICSECFMPLCYGGGVMDAEHARRILALGVEKIAFNTAAVEAPSVVREASRISGAQSVVVSIDVRRKLFGKYEVMTRGGKRSAGLDPVEHAQRAVDLGAGELLVTSIDRDGTWSGYDLELIARISSSVHVPVIANGGARTVQDIAQAIHRGGAAAAAIGSMAVYAGPDQGVLIRFPSSAELEKAFSSSLDSHSGDH